MKALYNVTYGLLQHIGQLAVILSQTHLWATIDCVITSRAWDWHTLHLKPPEEMQSEANAPNINQLLLSLQLQVSTNERRLKNTCDVGVPATSLFHLSKGYMA